MFKAVINHVRNKLGMSSTENRYKLYSANPNIAEQHVRYNFSIYSIRRLLLNEGFAILKERNSFFIFAVFELGEKVKLDKWDCRLADYLPRFMVSRWYFMLKSGLR